MQPEPVLFNIDPRLIRINPVITHLLGIRWQAVKSETKDSMYVSNKCEQMNNLFMCYKVRPLSATLRVSHMQIGYVTCLAELVVVS